jgi:hypothetical protein
MTELSRSIGESDFLYEHAQRYDARAVLVADLGDLGNLKYLLLVLELLVRRRKTHSKLFTAVSVSVYK